MSRFILFVKAFLICLIVSNGLMLASYLVYQFVPEWIAQNIFVNLLCNGSENISSDVNMSFWPHFLPK